MACHIPQAAVQAGSAWRAGRVVGVDDSEGRQRDYTSTPVEKQGRTYTLLEDFRTLSASRSACADTPADARH